MSMNNSAGSALRLGWAGLRALIVLSVLCGVIYPLVVLGIGQAAFHNKANGSEIKENGKVVGSSLIGQRYDLPLKKGQETPAPDLKRFQPRPSNGLGENSVNTRYTLILSGATNLAGDSKELIKQVTDAKAAVIKDNSTPGYTVEPSAVPADAVTSSGSGLDPSISPQYAQLQAHRVADKNHLTLAQVEQLIDKNTVGRTLGFIGEPQVNVLKLNIALRELAG